MFYTIHKYPLELLSNQIVRIPEVHKMLCIQMQGEKPCLWAMVDLTSAEVALHIKLHGTGTLITDQEDLTYIGTIQAGAFVWHAFSTLKEGNI